MNDGSPRVDAFKAKENFNDVCVRLFLKPFRVDHHLEPFLGSFWV